MYSRKFGGFHLGLNLFRSMRHSLKFLTKLLKLNTVKVEDLEFHLYNLVINTIQSNVEKSLYSVTQFM